MNDKIFGIDNKPLKQLLSTRTNPINNTHKKNSYMPCDSNGPMKTSKNCNKTGHSNKECPSIAD